MARNHPIKEREDGVRLKRIAARKMGEKLQRQTKRPVDIDN